jgi:hypothetical protein
MGDKVNPKITKEVMLQFELVRRSGAVNMGIMENVHNKAAELGLKALSNLLAEDFQDHPYDVRNRTYIEILRRRGFYLRKYKIVS